MHIPIYDCLVYLFFDIASKNFTIGFPHLVNDIWGLESSSLLERLSTVNRINKHTTFQMGVEFGFNPIEVASPTFESLCLWLGRVNILVEPSGSSSPIIQLRSTIMFSNMVYLCSQTQFKSIRDHNVIHTSMMQNLIQKLARVWQCHKFSNYPWLALNIRQTLIGMLGPNVPLESGLLNVRSMSPQTLYIRWEGLTTMGPNFLNCDCWMQIQ